MCVIFVLRLTCNTDQSSADTLSHSSSGGNALTVCYSRWPSVSELAAKMSTLVEYQDRKKIFKTKCLSELKSQIGEWLYEICGDSAWMLELWDESWGEWLEVDDNQALGDKNRVRVRPLTVFSATPAVTGVDTMMVL